METTKQENIGLHRIRLQMVIQKEWPEIPQLSKLYNIMVTQQQECSPRTR